RPDARPRGRSLRSVDRPSCEPPSPAIARRRPGAGLHQDGAQRRLRLCSLRRSIAGAVMSGRFLRMGARLWPDSLFGRLAMILFSGLVAAHVLAFVLIVLDRIAIEDELGSKYAAVDIAQAVAILDYLKPQERPAWLERLSRINYRYVLRDWGELEVD